MSKKVKRDFAITLLGIADDTLETMLLKVEAFIEALRYYCTKNNYSVNLILVVSVHKSGFAIEYGTTWLWNISCSFVYTIAVGFALLRDAALKRKMLI